MTKNAYIDGKSKKLFFERDGLVYQSKEKFDLNKNGATRYEWMMFGIRPGDQPANLNDEASKMSHPSECFLDIDATINLLKHRVIDDGMVEQMRKRLGIKLKQPPVYL
jgi:hypothetical protein